MYAAIVELDSLSDTVGAAAEDHDLLGIIGSGAPVFDIIA